MKSNFFFVSVVCFAFILATSCGNNSNSSNKSEYELKMDLIDIEKSSPTNYLEADGTYKENFWGDKIKVNCIITNSATLASFKDIVVRVYYYSKTKTELGSEDYTIYEIISPNSTKTIEMKIDNYKNVNSIGWDVISATPVN